MTVIITLDNKTVDLLDTLQRLFDNDTRMPALTDEEVVTLALLTLKTATIAPMTLPVETLLVHVVATFRSEYSSK